MTEQNNAGENQDKNQLENLTDDQIKEIEASEEFILNFKDEDYDDPDKAAELRQHLEKARTTIHQKRHFREKATKLEEQLKAGKPAPAKPAAPEKKEGDEKKGVDPVIALTFRQDHPELSKEVAAEVIRHASAYGVTPDEALESPIIKTFIKNSQNKEDVEDASVAPSRKSSTGIEKRDWSNASPAEIEAQRRKIMGIQ